MAIERNYFITMHQAGVHFENFTEVKFRDILLTGTGHRAGAQPGILFGRGQSLTSSDFKLQLFCTKIIFMSLEISGLLQQDMTSNIFYQSASTNFIKDKKTFAFAVIITKQLLTKQFSMNIKSSGK